jgi:hypothetical protein
MSRTQITLLVALVLFGLSAGVYFTRRATGGTDVGGPAGVSSWEVTLTAHGQLPKDKDGTVATAAPPDFRRQHVYNESWRSDELIHREGRRDAAKGADRPREAVWKPRPMTAGAEYRLTYTFQCVLGTRHPTPAMRAATNALDAAPAPEKDGTLKPTSRIQSDHSQRSHTGRPERHSTASAPAATRRPGAGCWSRSAAVAASPRAW